MGTRDLRTLWSPLVSLNQERHTQRRKAANFIFVLFIFCDKKSVEKSPMKTYMVKRAFWKISKKKKKSPHFQEGKKEFWNRHISRRKKTGVEIAEICGGFGQIPSFLLLKRVYEGCANPNPLTPLPPRSIMNLNTNILCLWGTKGRPIIK